MVCFWDLMIYNQLLTWDKNFQLEVYDMKIGFFLMDWSDFAFFWSAAIYQPMIKNVTLRLMTWKQLFFLGTSLVSAGCSNPRKPCTPPDSTYERTDKDIWANKNSDKNDMKRYAESSCSLYNWFNNPILTITFLNFSHNALMHGFKYHIKVWTFSNSFRSWMEDFMIISFLTL